MKKKIEVGIIGAGRIGLHLERDKKRIKPATHFGMWLNNKRTNLKYISDKSKKSYFYARKMAPESEYYKDYKKLLSKSPKIISIATWKDNHFKITRDSILIWIRVLVL